MESGCLPSPRQCSQFSSQRAASKLTGRRDGAGSSGSKGHSRPAGRCFSQGGLNQWRQVSWKLTFLSRRAGPRGTTRSHACPRGCQPPSLGRCLSSLRGDGRAPPSAGLLSERVLSSAQGMWGPARTPRPTARARDAHCDGDRDKAERADVTHQYFLERGSPSSLCCLGRPRSSNLR